jgi:hypothetical protein
MKVVLWHYEAKHYIKTYNPRTNTNIHKIHIFKFNKSQSFVHGVDKSTFNNDGRIIHSMLNILVLKSLSNLPNLSLYLLSRVKC